MGSRGSLAFPSINFSPPPPFSSQRYRMVPLLLTRLLQSEVWNGTTIDESAEHEETLLNSFASLK